MSSQLRQSHAFGFKRAALALALMLSAISGYAQRAMESPFAHLSGYWSGAGTITMRDGATERLRCKATYAVSPTGRALNQSLRCASDSYRLDISSNVTFEAGAISGTWSEMTRNASGSLSGRASSTEIRARVDGAGFSAGIDVLTRGNQQSVTIRPQSGTDVAGVSITMRKI